MQCVLSATATKEGADLQYYTVHHTTWFSCKFVTLSLSSISLYTLIHHVHLLYKGFISCLSSVVLTILLCFRFKAIQISQYAVHVLRWLREFPREQIHIINGDNLIRDPYAEINKVCAVFCLQFFCLHDRQWKKLITFSQFHYTVLHCLIFLHCGNSLLK